MSVAHLINFQSKQVAAALFPQTATHRVRIVESSASVSDGKGGFRQTDFDLAVNVPGMLRPASARESVLAGQVIVAGDYLLTIPAVHLGAGLQVTPKHRLVVTSGAESENAEAFDIKQVLKQSGVTIDLLLTRRQ